jgi:hypothetical protein
MAQIPVVAQCRAERPDVREIVCQRIVLFHENFVVAPVPSPSPVLVSPYQEEREVGLLGAEDLIHGALKQSATVEPVVVIGEATEPGAYSEFGLPVTYFGDSKVVETEISRQVRLIMPSELRSCPGDVGPLGKPWTPPSVVLWNGVVLRKIERHRSSLGKFSHPFLRLLLGLPRLDGQVDYAT